MVLRLGLVVSFLVMVGGCDRAPEPPLPPPPPAPALSVEAITPLPAGRPTHLASDGAGRMAWFQETTGAAPAFIFTLNEGTLAQVTSLGTVAVLKAMDQPAAHGTIQSLCYGPDGNLYFFFMGGQRRQTLAALGCFTQRTGQVRLLADTAQLMATSGMGLSIALARGTVVRSGKRIWLWIRHTDDYSLLSIDLDRPGSTLRRPFEHLSGPGVPPRLVGQNDDLAAAANGAVIWLDRDTGQLWTITPEGAMSRLADLSDLPRRCSMPVVDDRGRIFVVAPDGPAFNQSSDSPPVVLSPASAARYPAAILIEKERRTVLPLQGLDASGNLRLADLVPGAVVADRSSWVVYNIPSGDLFRLRLKSERK